MPFTTSGQEMEWALFLQPRSPHGAQVLSWQRRDIIHVKWKTFILLQGKFTQDNIYHSLSESARFGRSC